MAGSGVLLFVGGVVEFAAMQEKRKIAVLVGDGMGDDPVAALGGKTPLQVAKMPDIRRVAALGHVQLVQTVPDGMAPGSDVANMGLLGYHAGENYTGRAAIEAAGARIPLAADDVAYRTNLVTVGEDGTMVDYSAGDMPTEDGRALIAALDGDDLIADIRFKEGKAHLTHGFLDIAFGQFSASAELLEYCAELLG